MKLFSELQLRGVKLRNRLGMSPMCMYCATEGLPAAWHLVHYGARAAGGVGLIIVEATAVDPAGRLTPNDLGLWCDSQVAAFKPLTDFIGRMGCVPGIQLAHGGRKASCAPPWEGGYSITPDQGGWAPVYGPSAIAFNANSPTPAALDRQGIARVIGSFTEAARRALEAGFKVIEVHAAHGYLLHEFLSPLANQRSDEYGGCFENRVRLLCEVVAAVRRTIPESTPLLVRISASDWVAGGWQIEESVKLAATLKVLGVDLIDCSSGGMVYYAEVPIASGYQVPFARRIRAEAHMPTAAVGLINAPQQAAEIIAQGDADLVLLGRALLREPAWVQRAAVELGVPPAPPRQYARAFK